LQIGERIAERQVVDGFFGPFSFGYILDGANQANSNASIIENHLAMAMDVVFTAIWPDDPMHAVIDPAPVQCLLENILQPFYIVGMYPATE
jgi:hypothetical protein